MSPVACAKRLKAIGLRVAFERDATSGFEFVVSDALGSCVAYGWSAGTKSDAAAEVLSHPAIALRLARSAAETPGIFGIPMICVNPGEGDDSFLIEFGPLKASVEKHLRSPGWCWSVHTTHTEDFCIIEAASAHAAARAAEAYLRTILSTLGAVAKLCPDAGLQKK